MKSHTNLMTKLLNGSFLDPAQWAEMSGGDDENLVLYRRIYRELKQLAERSCRGEKPDNSFQPTALLHEALLRIRGREEGWTSRSEFFGAAANTMRRLLIEHARKKKHRGALLQKRSHDLPQDAVDLPESNLELLALDEALEALGQRDGIAVSAVELVYLAGLTVAQASEVLDVPQRTLERKLALARAFLHRHLEG